MLRRGADVFATDGRFGTLADVVIDPIADELTHLVVAPDDQLQQARVVPRWLTSETDDGIKVELDVRHVKLLQRRLPGDFVRAAPPDRAEGDRFDDDLRFKTVLYHPYFEDPSCDPGAMTGVAMAELDLRCGSDVVSSNDRLLGRIVGFLIDDGLMRALIVRSGLAGFTHDVAVPIGLIADVVADMVLLDIDRHEFRALPTTTAVPKGHARRNLVEVAEHAAGRIWWTTRDRVRAAFGD